MELDEVEDVRQFFVGDFNVLKAAADFVCMFKDCFLNPGVEGRQVSCTEVCGKLCTDAALFVQVVLMSGYALVAGQVAGVGVGCICCGCFFCGKHCISFTSVAGTCFPLDVFNSKAYFGKSASPESGFLEKVFRRVFFTSCKRRDMLVGTKLSTEGNTMTTLNVNEDFKDYRPSGGAELDNIHANGLNLLRLGIDPYGEDSVFGTPFVYCGAHMRAHTSGWCTVRLVLKRPLNAQTAAEAKAEVAELGLPVD